MGNAPDYAIRQHVWNHKIPETVLNLYFNHIRGLPAWQRISPEYIHPAIQHVVESAHDAIQIKTERFEYAFVFEPRSTLVPEAAEYVQTGTLKVFCNGSLVLGLGVSPSDSDPNGIVWTARCVEEYSDGEWVAELSGLAEKLADYEDQQSTREARNRENALSAVSQLQAKLAKLPAEPKKSPWWKRLVRR